jgi:hypothetical protein
MLKGLSRRGCIEKRIFVLAIAAISLSLLISCAWQIVVMLESKGLAASFAGEQLTSGVSPTAVSESFYFAEGYTGQNFQEYLCLGNAGDDEATATVTYMFQDGSTQQQDILVPPCSRATVNVNAIVGPDKEVSAKVEADQEIVAERPMYFNYNGVYAGGHDTVGATRTAYIWYFAEGYTGPGFEEWVCVLNPGDNRAGLTFYFQTEEEGQKKVEGLSVPPHARRSFKANELLGGKTYQTSLMLTSDQLVVAERPVYFDYNGSAELHWKGGHCVTGVTSLAREYYFAEGTTRAGFEEWLTLQNPNPQEITVNATYQLGAEQGEPITRAYKVASASRKTIYVPGPEGAGSGKDVSIFLSSSQLFLAERPTYFAYYYNGLSATGGHCVIGADSRAGEWFFAEGYTGPGSNQWLCLQNPGDQDALVEITYYAQKAGELPVKNETIPAGSRRTLMVNEHAGADFQLSTRIKVISGSDIVAERPMYFLYNGVWDGGHDVVGFMP